MSNLLVLKNYTITDHSKWHCDRSHETKLKVCYDTMEVYCRSSAFEYLQDLDDIIVTRGEEENIRDVFRDHFEEIYEIWSEGNNVLYTDLDVLFKKPVKIFNQFEHFSMFNYTDPKQTRCDHFNVDLPHFFNCGVRYYPKDMDHKIWDLGFALLDNWDENRWDSEQVIYNIMMWKQGLSLSQVYRPELAYQYLIDNMNYNNSFNQIPLQNSSIIHVHGSRGSDNRADLMSQLYNLPM